jgi:hypothetical protein
MNGRTVGGKATRLVLCFITLLYLSLAIHNLSILVSGLVNTL